MFTSSTPDNLKHLRELQLAAKLTLNHIHAAHERSVKISRALQEKLVVLTPSDCSVITYGSLARCEMTSKSDLDWTLLVDGQCVAKNQEDSNTIRRAITGWGPELNYSLPNSDGAFGKMCFSQNLVHDIGGEQDVNSNLTRRVLLLLESQPLSNRHVQKRVIGNILSRYLDPRHFAYKSINQDFFPRFLMNDIVRFWRTVGVDHAHKRSERGDEGWALKNAKLRFSRKLLFTTGVLLAYDLPLQRKRIEPGVADGELPVVAHLQDLCEMPPLELLARALLLYGKDWDKLHSVAADLFKSYDEFLSIIDDKAHREHLKNLASKDAAKDPLFTRIRELARTFQNGLNLFLVNGPDRVKELTLKYAIF